MSSDISKIYTNFHKAVIDYLLPKVIDLAISGFEGCETLITDKKIKEAVLIDAVRKFQNSNDRINQPLNNYTLYFNEINEIVSHLPTKKTTSQSLQRFIIDGSETPYIQFLKFFKSIAFKIFKLVRSKKSNGLVTGWNHQINLKNLAFYYFNLNVISQLSLIEEIIDKEVCDCLSKIKAHHEASILKQDVNNLPEESLSILIVEKKNTLISAIEQNIEEFLTNTKFQFYDAYKKIDTIELSASKFSDEGLNQIKKSNITKWETTLNGWNSTKIALLDEWLSYLEIIHLEQKITAESISFNESRADLKIDDVENSVQDIIGLVEEIKTQILSCDKESFSSEIKKIQYTSQKKLKGELIPKLRNQIVHHKIGKFINQFEASLIRNIDVLSKEHFIIKSSTYDKPVNKEDLTKISHLDLITFEILPTLQQQINEIQQSLFVVFEENTQTAESISSMISYTLTSALSTLEDGESSTLEISGLLNEGLERVNNSLNHLLQELNQHTHKNISKLAIAVSQFCSKLIELANAENVRKLNLRIKKAKTVQRAGSMRKLLLNRVHSRFNQLINKFRAYYRWSFIKIHLLKQKFVLTADKPSITREISDFLSESQSVFNKLPIIYMKLYKIEPIDDIDLFIGRDIEISKLSKSHNDWSQGKPVSALVIGEKWGGKTSFINHTIDHINFKYPIIKYTVIDNISTENDLLIVFKGMFPAVDINDFEELVTYLNGEHKRVIVFEDIQNLFLRKMNGFDALKTLYVLINRTQNNIFWIISITKYAWNFLNKSVNLFEYFSYQIEMESLTKEQMVELILARNKITGYKVRFNEKKSTKSSKKTKQFTDLQKQKELKEQFFSSLNSFAKGNISLALRFWLLSILKIDQSSVQIGAFNKPDLSFVNMISMDKVFMLHALVLHDGLSDIQLSEVINVSQSTCRLNLIALTKNGIILKAEETYSLNPLLYRNVINLLKAKNLLH